MDNITYNINIDLYIHTLRGMDAHRSWSGFKILHYQMNWRGKQINL